MAVKANDVVVEQDVLGDFYYIIRQGRGEVTCQTVKGTAPIKLAELGLGDSFRVAKQHDQTFIDELVSYLCEEESL